MKAIIALFFFLAIVLLAYVDNTITGSITAGDNPCRIVSCNVRLFGFIKEEPELIGITPDGMAVCHCPQESMDYLFYVALQRKY